MKIWIALFSLWSFGALAAEDCLSPTPSVERLQVWNLQKPNYAAFFLPSSNISGPYPTGAAIHLLWNQNLEVAFDFNLPPGQVSLPYTVYQLRLEIGEGDTKEVITQDYTNGCTEPGFSFFPGAVVRIPAIAFSNTNPSTSMGTPLRIQVWGH